MVNLFKCFFKRNNKEDILAEDILPEVSNIPIMPKVKTSMNVFELKFYELIKKSEDIRIKKLMEKQRINNLWTYL